jgi:hypothetical protein
MRRRTQDGLVHATLPFVQRDCWLRDDAHGVAEVVRTRRRRPDAARLRAQCPDDESAVLKCRKPADVRAVFFLRAGRYLPKAHFGVRSWLKTDQGLKSLISFLNRGLSTALSLAFGGQLVR